jgi:hypothetical protein
MNRQLLDAVLTAIALLGFWGSTSLGNEKTGPINGFYYLTEQGLLGDPVTLDIPKAELKSLDNFNSAFWLTIMTPDAEKEEPPFVLVVENQRYRNSGQGVAGDGKFYDFNGINEKQARQIAKYLRIKPQVRSHPGYRLAVQFRTEKKNYALGEPVRVTMTVKNVGTNVLSFMARGIVRRNDQFSFLATHNGRPLPARDRPTHAEWTQHRIQLKPQEEFEKEVELSDWFELDKDGQYTLLGAYYLEVVPNGGTLATCRTIWEDYATGRFKFRIIGPRHVSARPSREDKRK